MKYFILFLLLCALVLVVVAGCIPAAKVPNRTVVGYFDYRPTVQKVVDARAKECEGVEGCVPGPITEQDVLGVITGVKRQMESEGAQVIGVEASEGRIWFQK